MLSASPAGIAFVGRIAPFAGGSRRRVVARAATRRHGVALKVGHLAASDIAYTNTVLYIDIQYHHGISK
tara:strand:- start:382 stop:588 length:207 start_codon:yes stop_codon:yes gene_type:complete